MDNLSVTITIKINDQVLKEIWKISKAFERKQEKPITNGGKNAGANKRKR
jgi:hypothetical protein